MNGPTTKDIKWLHVCRDSAGLFSTCGKRQYFAIVLDQWGHVVGTGWNGGPKGAIHCVDGGCPRLSQGSAPGSSYDNCIAIHAEQNALLHSDYTARAAGGTIYVNGSPCFTCAKLVVNSGLTRVVHLSDTAYAQEADVLQFMKDNGVDVFSVEQQV